MGWSIGYDNNLKRDIGYGVPAICDHPDCDKQIHRGLSYVCGSYPRGGEHGCGLHFCVDHLHYFDEVDEDTKIDDQVCERCLHNNPPFTPKPDTAEWLNWKLTDESWHQWRDENPDEVQRIKQQLEAQQ